MEKLKGEELSDLRRQKLESPQNPWESVKHVKIYLLSLRDSMLKGERKQRELSDLRRQKLEKPTDSHA